MISIPQEKLLKIYDKLPQEIKEALFSYENALVNFYLAKKFNLSKKKLSQLAGLVGLVLMGVLKKEEMPHHLAYELEINPETAFKIYRILNRKIFFSLREAIKKAREVAKKAGLIEVQNKEKKKAFEEPINLKFLRPVLKENFTLKLNDKNSKKEKVLLKKENLVVLKKEKEVKPQKLETLKLETKKESLKPKFEIPGLKPKVKPIADIKKPKIEFEEIEEAQEPLFGKIEFPKEAKKIIKEKKKPEIKVVEYKKPQPKTPFEKPIDFSEI